MSKKTSQKTAPWRSKLTPYTREIAKWRSGPIPKSYAEIAALLRADFGLEVHPDTISSFVLVRARAKPRATIPDFFLQADEDTKPASQPKAHKQAIAKPVAAPVTQPQHPALDKTKPPKNESNPPTHYDGPVNPKDL